MVKKMKKYRLFNYMYLMVLLKFIYKSHAIKGDLSVILFPQDDKIGGTILN